MTIETLLERVWERKGVFLFTFFLVFTLTYLVCVALDFYPEPAADEDQATAAVEAVAESESMATTTQAAVVTEPVPHVIALPTAITIKKLDKTVVVHNPASRAITDLDAALLDGVVRHPDSATLDEEGNVFILGHSSYLPNVFNKNFQAFNGIQDLAWGDTIEVDSGEQRYIYRVEKVYRAKAAEVTVPLIDTGHMLTLATCNSFGAKDDRYIVEAKRIDEVTS